MKTKILLALSLVVKYASLLLGLATLPAFNMLPERYMKYAVIAFGLASVLKDSANRIGDWLDDWKLNNSFGKIAPVILAALLLTSCANGAFLGVSKEGWQAIAKDAASGALKGAAATALPAYARERATTSAKAVYSPLP